MRTVANKNRVLTSLIGQGYHGGVVTLSQTERNLPTTANVDAMDFKDLACWLIVQIGPISLNVTTPSRGFVTNAKNAFTRNAAIMLHRAMITK